MIRRVILAAVAGVLLASPVLAHGGGGGFVAVPIYMAPPQLSGANPGDYSKIHTVAVISAIGDSLTLQHLSFLDTTTKSLDTRSWKIDDLVDAVLQKYLGSRFAFKAAEYNRAALAAIPNGHLSVSTKPFAQFLTTVKSDGVDAYFVVRPDVEADGRPDVQGTALVTAASSLPVLWFNYEIDIVDAHTLATLAKVTSRVQLRRGVAPSIPGFILPQLLNPAQDLTLTPQQNNLLDLSIVHDLPITLVETLRPLSLGVSLPEPGARKLVPFPAGHTPYADIRSLGIVSAIGDSIEFASVGSFGIGLDEPRMPAPADWNIDGHIEALMRGNLSSQFTVKDAGEARSALLQASLFTPDGKARDTLTELPARDDLDAYLVVLKHPRNFQGMNCAGLDVCRFGGLMHATNFLGADYVVVLVDAHTRKVLAWHVGVTSPQFAMELPVEEIGDELWPKAPPQASAGQLEQVHGDFVRLIDDSVPETLLHMLLTGKMIASDFASEAGETPVAAGDRGTKAP
jgi:hypothetical protein